MNDNNRPQRESLIERVLMRLPLLRRLRLLGQQNEFILFELKRINEALRSRAFAESGRDDRNQTRASFDYQWDAFHEGIAMANDASFMNGLQQLICEMTGLEAGWFSGKKVLDIGCGAGRFSFGLLSLNANVTACDQSDHALRRTTELCKPFANRLETRKIDLLDWDETGEFDLVFCFGVTHHTGNTYLAVRNAAAKVRASGKLFLMIYGFPERLADFAELNSQEQLRQELRPLGLADKKARLIERFGQTAAHGWFDAVSPRINDLLSFEEIGELLTRLGFTDIRRTVENRNHHVVATRT